MSRHYVTLEQLIAERPFLTERWVRRLVSERRVPFSKVPGSNRLLFDLDDLDALVENGRVEPRTHSSLRSISARRSRAS